MSRIVAHDCTDHVNGSRLTALMQPNTHLKSMIYVITYIMVSDYPVRVKRYALVTDIVLIAANPQSTALSK